MELPKQFDNINQRVIDDLKATLKCGSKVSMAAASFSIYAFEALQKELESVDELRFISLLATTIPTGPWSSMREMPSSISISWPRQKATKKMKCLTSARQRT